MFDINHFYETAESGHSVDENALKDYLKSFRTIILWGAGNLGTAVGRKLLSMEIDIECYWDERAESLQNCNGIEVRPLFDKEYDKESTLVISCIVNGSLGKEWTESVIVEHGGYPHFLYGMLLYEAIICPLKAGEPFQIRTCTESKACSLCNCGLYTNLLHQSKQIEESPDELIFQLITFIISTRCTLKCKYCGQRLNEYDRCDRVDFDLDEIKSDMDLFFGAVDFVGMVSIIGGEPFLHPKLGEIVQHCLTKDNFGVINITTNGVCEISPELLKKIKNDRVKISVSRYDAFLNRKQIELIDTNIRHIREAGIVCSVSTPLWYKPDEIAEQDFSETELLKNRSNCKVVKMCAAVKNGRFIPCSIAENMDGLHLYKTESDCLNIRDSKNLKQRLKKHLQQPYYEACRYCAKTGSGEIPAGEQA